MIITNNEWNNSIECPGSHYTQTYAKDSSIQWNICVRYTHLAMQDHRWTI